MISLGLLARLAEEYADDLTHQVRSVRVGHRVHDTDTEPVLMGTVNLSRDSTYRESIAVSRASAVRKASVQWAQGAHCVDLGAESSTARAATVSGAAQLDLLLPVVEELAAAGVVVSVESYRPDVVKGALAAGAGMINLTGSAGDDVVFGLVADAGATLVLCRSTTANVREIAEAGATTDPFAALVDHFGPRVERALAAGVQELVLDPGLGFYYADLVDPLARSRYQAEVLLQTFRLRRLGFPVCHAMPHAFDIFEEEFRTAEGFFTVLAKLGGTGVFRTHEVARVRAVLGAMDVLGTPP